MRAVRRKAEETLGVTLKVKAITAAEILLQGEGLRIRYHRDTGIFQMEGSG